MSRTGSALFLLTYSPADRKAIVFQNATSKERRAVCRYVSDGGGRLACPSRAGSFGSRQRRSSSATQRPRSGSLAFFGSPASQPSSVLRLSIESNRRARERGSGLPP